MTRLCALLLLTLLAGCSRDMDPEDRRFYNRGWLFPHRDIDNDPAFDGPSQVQSDPQMPKRVHPEHYIEDPFVN